MKYIIGNFLGTNKLWHVFWLHNFLLGTLITAAVDSIANTGNIPLLLTYLGLTVLWSVWVFVGLWQCAFNANHKFWGYIARVISVLGGIAFLSIAYRVIA
jgi:hypothetical protein